MYQRGHELVEEAVLLSEERVGIAHGTAQDAADDVAGLGIAWQLTVGNREGHSPQVVGTHAHGDVDGLPRPLRRRGVDVTLRVRMALPSFGGAGEAFLLKGGILQSRNLLLSLDDGLEDIGVIVGVLALHHAHQTLKAHARVDDVHRQRLQRTVSLTVELHEHDVPYLDDLRVVLVHQLAATLARGLALFRCTAVHMNLRAGTTGTRVAHLPEVVVLVAVDDMVFGHVLGPIFGSLVVARDIFFR